METVALEANQESARVTKDRTKACKVCQSAFIPVRPLQSVCGPSCAMKKVRSDKKREREEIRERKQAIKRIPDLEAECRQIVQKIARIRDRDEGCISCDKPANWDGQWHGSHFRSHGAASAVQFHLWNINKACWICNKLYSGRIDQYEPKLIAKIGQEKVDWLKSQNQIVRHDREYLTRFKKVMNKRLRRMERE